jgi:hypothetical protein
MDRRFDARLSEMLAQAEVPAELIDGFLAPQGLRSAVRGLPTRARTTATHDRVPDRPPLEA